MNEIFLVLVSYVIILTFLGIEICIFFASDNRYVEKHFKMMKNDCMHKIEFYHKSPLSQETHAGNKYRFQVETFLTVENSDKCNSSARIHDRRISNYNCFKL